MNNIQNIFQIVLLMFLSTILFGCQSVPRIHRATASHSSRRAEVCPSSAGTASAIVEGFPS